MGLLGFLRNKRPGSPRRSRKDGNARSSKRKSKASANVDATNSTEPTESALADTEGITENFSPEMKKNGAASNASSQGVEGGIGSNDSEDAPFEIVESPTPKTPLSESRANEPKDDKSILEKFKAKSPAPKGTKVAERTAWLEKSAFKEEKEHLSEVSVPTSRENAMEKKKFWEGKTFHKETSNAPDALPHRSKADVQAKKKWLETVAFTPEGGGNMEQADGNGTPEKRKHTIGLLPASPVSTGSDVAGEQRTAKDLMKAMQSYDEKRLMSTNKVYLDKQDDPNEDAYEAWFKAGLLRWRTASHADEDDKVFSSFPESQGRKMGQISTKAHLGVTVKTTPPEHAAQTKPEMATEQAETHVQVESDSKDPGDDKQDKGNELSTLLSLASLKDDKMHTFVSLDSSEDQIQSVKSAQDVPDSILAPGSMDEVSTKTVVNLDTSVDSPDGNAASGELHSAGRGEADATKEDANEKSHEEPRATANSVPDSTTVESERPNIVVGGGPHEASPSRPLAPVTRGVSKRSTESDMEITIPDTEATDEFVEPDLYEGILDDDEDEEFKELFHLQQHILQEYRKEPDQAADGSDDGSLARESIDKVQKDKDDASDTTNSSQVLQDYSKKYFAGAPSESVDYNSGEESGVNLEPSIVTHASSITHDEISVGDGIHFADSLDGRMLDMSTDAMSFDLLDEMKNHDHMLSHVAAVSTGQPPAPGGTKDHSPVQPSRKVSTGEELFVSSTMDPREPRRLSGDHAPAQPSRKASVEGQEMLGCSPGRRGVARMPLDPADHAPSQPMRQASVDDPFPISMEKLEGFHSKHDSPPVSPVRVASSRNLDRKSMSDSIRKARARKLAVARRGQYVMWLTRSRAISFRKTAEVPMLSCFVKKENKKDEEKERSFDSMKESLRSYISPSRRRTESEALARLASARTSLSKMMRRPFKVHKATRSQASAKHSLPVLTPFLSVPPRLKKTPLPPRPPKKAPATAIVAHERWTFV